MARFDATGGRFVYFPYLQGRQAELLAIRSLLTDPRDRKFLIPVIEPLNADIGGLRLCLNQCDAHHQPTVVIINPTRHQLAVPGAVRTWLREARVLLGNCALAIPAFKTSAQSNGAQVAAALGQFPNRPVAVVHHGAGLTDAEVQALGRNNRVAWHIVDINQVPARQTRLLPAARTVLLRDGFHKLQRNADYGAAEFFSDLHQNYRPAAGFGDYTCIGAAFQKGGGAAAAVAIHAAFKHPPSGDIWMDHFVSDDRDMDVGDVATKFLQAAEHLIHAARQRPTEFGNNQGLNAYRNYVRRSYFPGLSKNKEHMIVHHMSVVLDVLSGAL